MRIYVHWEGPFSHDTLQGLTENVHRGLYQVYAHHLVYGHGSLVYIGSALDQTFSGRIPQHNFPSGSEADPRNVMYYVGMLKYPDGQAPNNQEWRNHVCLAEKILIHAHAPSYNSDYIGDANDSNVNNVCVMNTGAHRSLMPVATYLFNRDEIENNYRFYLPPNPA